jgi:hypothetical protein
MREPYRQRRSDLPVGSADETPDLPARNSIGGKSVFGTICVWLFYARLEVVGCSGCASTQLKGPEIERSRLCLSQGRKSTRPPRRLHRVPCQVRLACRWSNVARCSGCRLVERACLMGTWCGPRTCSSVHSCGSPSTVHQDDARRLAGRAVQRPPRHRSASWCGVLDRRSSRRVCAVAQGVPATYRRGVVGEPERASPPRELAARARSTGSAECGGRGWACDRRVSA